MAEYDRFAQRYDSAHGWPDGRIMEIHSIRITLDTLLDKPDVKVLELACGTGFYTSRLIDWGASSVTAVDLSPLMVQQAADKLADHVSSGQARFLVADGAEPQSFAPDGSAGYFDVVFAAWFLNYAQTKAQLTAMFETISRNLKPGGVFLGEVPHPTDNLHERAAVYSCPPLNQVLPLNCYTHELDSKDGWALRVYMSHDGVDFQTWHLKKQVYEEAARHGGMKGHIEWKGEVFPREDWGNRLGFVTKQDRQIRKENPHLGIIVVSKN